MLTNKDGAVDFAAVNRAALRRLPEILRRWLPGGWGEGREYVVRNPKRRDQQFGSFKINIENGRWADFATGDKGGGPDQPGRLSVRIAPGRGCATAGRDA